MFIDGHGRKVTYLRLSVTDRCDFRCQYCMGEDVQFLPRKQLLNLEEIARVAKIFADNGTTKFRLTGGEPLIRQNVAGLIKEIKQYQGVDEVAITTNGSQLGRLAAMLKSAGLDRLNISLDTLQPQAFKAITRVGDLPTVLEGIETALAVGLKDIRLNAVIMRGKNDEQILPLIEFARSKHINIAFIEEMPLGEVSHSRQETYLSSAAIRQVIHASYPLHPALFKNTKQSGPATYWLYKDGNPSQVGFISPHSCNFCADCNRVRLTVEGRLLLCLGHENSVDVRALLRGGKSDKEIAQTIQQALQHKPERHTFALSEKPVIFRHMNYTGG